MADKIETPEEVKKDVLELVKVSSDTGKIRKGVNEVTKAVERGIAKVVVIAQDVQPAEVVMHIPKLCSEKGIAYAYVNTKKELGDAAGIKVGCSSIAVVEAGSGNELLSSVVKRLPKAEKKGE
ncbi:MAG: 50S ribosomal protein L7Ae [Candidatus Micrarchaeota archaeon]|nr:50S ribosomal protein L7Ae [Candidatus Micrarchaeota archaeon]